MSGPPLFHKHPTTQRLKVDSVAGVGVTYARIQVHDIILLAAECRNPNAVQAEIASLFIERGTPPHLEGDPIGLINGFADANNPLNWTGKIPLDGLWTISAEILHIASITHQCKILMRNMR